jgi:hypothetical protein
MEERARKLSRIPFKKTLIPFIRALSINHHSKVPPSKTILTGVRVSVQEFIL